MATLKETAAQMRLLLSGTQKGYVTKSLYRGLHVLLERRADTYRLAVARTRLAPGLKEMEIVGRAFAVPVGTTWAPGKPKNPHAQGFIIMECQWQEQEKEEAGIKD